MHCGGTASTDTRARQARSDFGAKRTSRAGNVALAPTWLALPARHGMIGRGGRRWRRAGRRHAATQAPPRRRRGCHGRRGAVTSRRQGCSRHRRGIGRPMSRWWCSALRVPQSATLEHCRRLISAGRTPDSSKSAPHLLPSGRNRSPGHRPALLASRLVSQSADEVDVEDLHDRRSGVRRQAQRQQQADRRAGGGGCTPAAAPRASASPRRRRSGATTPQPPARWHA